MFPLPLLYLHVYCVLLLSLILGVSLHPCSLKEQLCHKGTLDKYIRPNKTKQKTASKGGPVTGKYVKDYLFLKDQRDKAVGAAESFTLACMQGGVLNFSLAPD